MGFGIIGMNGPRPPVAFVLAPVLPCQSRPACLFACHATFGVIGPKYPFDRLDRAAETRFARLPGLPLDHRACDVESFDEDFPHLARKIVADRFIDEAKVVFPRVRRPRSVPE